MTIPVKNVQLPLLAAALSVMPWLLEQRHQIVRVRHLAPTSEFNYVHFVQVVITMITRFYLVSRVIQTA